MHRISKSNTAGPTRCSARLQNQKKGIKLPKESGDHGQSSKPSPTTSPQAVQTRTTRKKKPQHLDDGLLDEEGRRKKQQLSGHRKTKGIQKTALTASQRRHGQHTQRAIEETTGLPSDPVAHWAATGSWPEKFAEADVSMVYNLRLKKLPKAIGTGTSHSKAPNTTSFRSSHSKGTLAYAAECYANMAKHHIYVTPGRHVRNESKELCTNLLKPADYPTPPQLLGMEQEDILILLNNIRCRNESMLQFQVTPWIVPTCGFFPTTEDGKEIYVAEINTQWSCAVMGSTLPKPDVAVGLSAEVLSVEELDKLKNHYASPSRSICFTPFLYFPFLIAEAKTGYIGLENAHLQNIHSASIAVRAIVKLYQAAFKTKDPKRFEDVFNQILVFTVSHDNGSVVIYGHFAVQESGMAQGASNFLRRRKITRGKRGRGTSRKDKVNSKDSHVHLRPTLGEYEATNTEIPATLSDAEGFAYYRCYVQEFSLRRDDDRDLCKPYNFIRNLYRVFGPEHLQRIKEAAAALEPVEKRAPSNIIDTLSNAFSD